CTGDSEGAVRILGDTIIPVAKEGIARLDVEAEAELLCLVEELLRGVEIPAPGVGPVDEAGCIRLKGRLAGSKIEGHLAAVDLLPADPGGSEGQLLLSWAGWVEWRPLHTAHRASPK